MAICAQGLSWHRTTIRHSPRAVTGYLFMRHGIALTKEQCVNERPGTGMVKGLSQNVSRVLLRINKMEAQIASRGRGIGSNVSEHFLLTQLSNFESHSTLPQSVAILPVKLVGFFCVARNLVSKLVIHSIPL